jgi:MEMO1 family protein
MIIRKISRLVFTIMGVTAMALSNCQAGENTSMSVRKPAVAGQFYPDNPATLKKDIQSYIADGKKLDATVRMLISPHAGYIYSAPVAGKGFAAIDKSITTVFLIGPSHHEYFSGIAVSSYDYYETPLGRIPVDKKICTELRKNSMVTDNRAAENPEHSLEVQLPFLQTILPSFAIIPILTGECNLKAVAELIKPYINKTTLVIASSDLSHFQPSPRAKEIDGTTVETILSGNADGFLDACGDRPIRVVMHLAKMLGLTPVKLDARNSYETVPQAGDNRVVGYASIAYVEKAATSASPVEAKQKTSPIAEDIPTDVKQFLLKLARSSLESNVKGEKVIQPEQIPAITKSNKGCFVTLTKHGDLRGCIGYIEPIKPLFLAVMENARNAALSDPRFPAVSPQELKDIKLEISVLTEPQPLEYKDPQDLLNKLVPGRDGIILEKGWASSTFLPQVWDQLPDKVQFLEHLSLKGGMPADGWKTASVKRYFAIHFVEEK